MIDVSHSFWIPAAPDQVFDYLANPSNDTRWQASCKAAELLDASCVTGSRYRIVFGLLGREMRFLCEVTERQPPRCYAFKVLEGSFKYQGRYEFDAEGLGTRVNWHFQADPGSFFGLLPSSLLRKVVLSQVQHDTERLCTLWETPAPA